MIVNLEEINLLLIEEDLEGLIEAGAPEDEYFSEAEKIFEALSKEADVTRAMIVETISLIWKRSFGLSDSDLKLRFPAIKNIAHNIVN